MHATLLHIAQIVKESSGVSQKLLRIIFTAKDIEIFLATYARSFFCHFLFITFKELMDGQKDEQTKGRMAVSELFVCWFVRPFIRI